MTNIIDDVTQQQRLASNPNNSVWVSASAGSGKTKVLTDRVLRLLLTETSPEKILCLTFTNAASAEMANRINGILTKWAICKEEELIDEITKLNGLHPTKEMLSKARQLFIHVLETPGGMKIMTIHAFCQSVLKRFPIEASVPPQFEVIDDSIATELLWQAVQETFLNDAFADDLLFLSDYLGENDIQNIFKYILSNKNELLEDLERFKDNSLQKELEKYFGHAYKSVDDIILSRLSKEKFAALQGVCLKKDHTPFTSKTIKTNLRKYNEANKTPILTLEDVPLYFKTAEEINEWHIIHATCALKHLVNEILTSYETKKHQRSFMDYSDLIFTTKRLLSKSFMSQWVLFKLDGGIDHILVDEAQDTNPDSWEIISLIASDFFSGEGSKSDKKRTIFVVGDKKQSIFSFQGADPRAFEKMHHYFEKRVTEAQKNFLTIPLNVSFRSTPSVLNLVNYSLDSMPARKGVLEGNEQAVHIPYREADGGTVEIWPLTKNDPKITTEDWSIPTPTTASSGISKMAGKIADRIAQMLQGEILFSKNRPIRPSDIMILVKKRGPMIKELVHALKERNIPLAGVDRIMLSNHIAIQDLLALAKFTLLQEDDLNLACLLKSPLLNCSEDDLFALAYNREDKSLWSRLQEKLPQKASYLTQLLNQADKMPVFEFFAYILGPLKGRIAFQERLGNEVNEALDEFLTLTLNFENTQIPSLENFLRWFSSRDVEIKRDSDQSGIDAVRIMTVHGSKGLQGNIVFIADATIPCVGVGKERFFRTQNNLPIFIPRASFVTPKTQELKDLKHLLQIEEYNRLLYVALTRAADRLYICGFESGKQKENSDDKGTTSEQQETPVTALDTGLTIETPKKGVKTPNKPSSGNGNWYDLVTSALPTSLIPDEDGIIRLSNPQTQEPKKTQEEKQIQQTVTLPRYLLEKAPALQPLSKPLMPSKSDLDTDEEATKEAISLAQERAIKRGTFIHKLLELLPNIPDHDRVRVAKSLKPDDIDIPENIFNLLNDEKFQVLFGKDSLAEVPVTGIINNRVASGQIDRLVVLDKEVWIIDYKSSVRVPKSVQDVSLTYKNQLKSYKSLINDIFPDKTVKTFLLWTQDLSLMEID